MLLFFNNLSCLPRPGSGLRKILDVAYIQGLEITP